MVDHGLQVGAFGDDAREQAQLACCPGYLAGQAGCAKAGLGIGDLHQLGGVRVKGVCHGREPGGALSIGSGRGNLGCLRCGGRELGQGKGCSSHVDYLFCAYGFIVSG